MMSFAPTNGRVKPDAIVDTDHLWQAVRERLHHYAAERGAHRSAHTDDADNAMLRLRLQRALDGAFDHHCLALAFMTKVANLLDRLACRRGDGLRRDLDVRIGRIADAGVEMNDVHPFGLQCLADELRFQRLGVERHDHQNLGFAAHGLSPVEWKSTSNRRRRR